jgi:lactose/L-arabinose transport system substrate-binding protein
MGRNRVSRRGLIGGAVGVGVGVGLTAPWAAVTRGAPASGAGRAAVAAWAQEDVTLDVFVHANHPFDLVKPLFEEANPGVVLNMMQNNDIPTFRAALAAGEGVPDLLWPEIEMVQELGKAGVLLDVTDIVEASAAELSPGKTAECFIPDTGRYAAFPGDIATVGLYYRQDLLDQAGVEIPDDWTWEEFIPAAQAVKAATGAASLYFPTTGTRDTAWLWQFILFQLGGAITNDDGSEITLDDERGIAAMELAKKLFEADVAIDEIPFEENYFATIAAGQVAMSPSAVWYRGFGIEPNVTDEQSGLGQWRVSLLPRAGADSVRTANLGGAAIASTTFTAHPEEVKAFMQFALGSIEGATACGEWGILPPYLPYLQSEAWTAVRSEAFGDFAFNEVWTQAVDQYPGTWYKQAVFAEAIEATGAAMMPMMTGEADIPSAMKELGDRVRTLSERYQG